MTTTDDGGLSLPRDDAWLAERVTLLRQVHFSDVPQGYPITTRFGIRARNRFGSIGAQSRQTTILVNRLFADPFVPVYVVDGTLAHELAHYAHGYGSGLPLLHPDPHRGGIVDKELDRRGLGDLNRRAEQWRRCHWEQFYKASCADLEAKRTAKRTGEDSRWSAVLERPGSRGERELQVRLAVLAPRFGFADPPFDVEWLRATVRQTSLSYWFSQLETVRIHGLVADVRVPGAVLQGELAYWLARRAVGQNAEKIYGAIRLAELEGELQEATQWRRRSWTAFRNRNHPLLARPASGGK